jgi:hypothetical protein
MNYYEFVTSIDKLDPNGTYVIRVPQGMSMRQMQLLRTALDKKNIQGIILPNYLQLEQLTPQQIQYLLDTSRVVKNENIQDAPSQ